MHFLSFDIHYRKPFVMTRGRPLSLQMVELQVRMDCGGCERAVRNALKIKGVDSVDIDLEQQKVTVTGYVDRNKVLKAVRRSGKKAEFWTYPYQPGNNYHPLRNDYYRDLNVYRETYNYRKHGFNTADHQPYVDSSHDHEMGALFSDDNAHALFKHKILWSDR
eukprot:Gb_21296 [translate_table: standard]